MKSNKNPKHIVKELVSKYMKNKPRKITLKLNYIDGSSSINIKGNDLNETIRWRKIIDFTSFADGVLEAYKKAYGELSVIPISFREEIYKNEKVSLDLYPTGSSGIFEIFIEYKENRT